MVEGARLEIVCTPKGYRGFESHSIRHYKKTLPLRRGFLVTVGSIFNTGLGTILFFAPLIIWAALIALANKITDQGKDIHDR